MNDVRNLLHTLHGDLAYREFAPQGASGAGAWPLLERVDAVLAAPNAAPPPLEAEPRLASEMRSAATARSGRGVGLKLSGYATGAPRAQTAASGDWRRAPLSDIFAKLEQAAG